MKILIPTAKEMKTGTPVSSQPLSKASQAVLEALQDYGVSDLQQLYHLKETAAQKELEHWQAMVKGSALTYPALELFNGLMYRQIAFDSTPENLAFIHRSIFITSSFYGIINALEPIAEHRLDFLNPLKVDGKTLKQFWRESFDAFVPDTEPILSLLSSEFEEVFSSPIRKKLIRVSFFEEKNGQLKKHSTISKKARGQLITQIIQNKITEPEQLKTLTFSGFTYQEDQSDAQHLVYIKSIT